MALINKNKLSYNTKESEKQRKKLLQCSSCLIGLKMKGKNVIAAACNINVFIVIWSL